MSILEFQIINSIHYNTASYGGGVFITANRYRGGGQLIMKGGIITGNTASVAGGGVYSIVGGINKTGGIITGYADDSVNGNVVKNDDVIQHNNGHAIYNKGEASLNLYDEDIWEYYEITGRVE